MGPKTAGSTGADFQRQIDQMFGIQRTDDSGEELEEENTNDAENEEAGDKKGA